MEDDYRQQDKYIIEGSIFDYHSPEEQPPANSPLGRFAQIAAKPDEEIDLAEAALLIGAMQYTGLDESYYLDWLDALAEEVRPIISPETDPLKSIENLSNFLTNEKGFHGNEENYADRRNSYLNDVLESKNGIPISLSLLYIELGKRLGLHFEGIGLPGHFIIRYRQLAPQISNRGDHSEVGFDNLERREESGKAGAGEDGDVLLDPFNGGALLTEEDCVALVRERYGRVVPVIQAFMRPVTNRQFLTRMLNNLKASCLGEKDFEQALIFQECLLLLNPQSAEEHRDRGVLYLREKRYGRAISDFRYYLRKFPNAQDANSVRRQLNAAFNEMVKRN